MPEGLPWLADRLDELMRTTNDREGKPYSDRALVRALASEGLAVSAQHVANLRRGRATNPSAVLVAGLSRVFDVPVNYFLDESPPEYNESSARDAQRSSQVDEVIRRVRAGRSRDVAIILAVLDQIGPYRDFSVSQCDPLPVHREA